MSSFLIKDFKNKFRIRQSDEFLTNCLHLIKSILTCVFSFSYPKSSPYLKGKQLLNVLRYVFNSSSSSWIKSPSNQNKHRQALIANWIRHQRASITHTPRVAGGARLSSVRQFKHTAEVFGRIGLILNSCGNPHSAYVCCSLVPKYLRTLRLGWRHECWSRKSKKNYNWIFIRIFIHRHSQAIRYAFILSVILFNFNKTFMRNKSRTARAEKAEGGRRKEISVGRVNKNARLIWKDLKTPN